MDPEIKPNTRVLSAVQRKARVSPKTCACGSPQEDRLLFRCPFSFPFHQNQQLRPNTVDPTAPSLSFGRVGGEAGWARAPGVPGLPSQGGRPPSVCRLEKGVCSGPEAGAARLVRALSQPPLLSYVTTDGNPESWAVKGEGLCGTPTILPLTTFSLKRPTGQNEKGSGSFRPGAFHCQQAAN